MKYINSKDDFIEFITYESNKYGRKNSRCPVIAVKENDILYKFNYLLRKTEYMVNCNKIQKSFWKLRLRLFENKYNINIPINVFDKGLKLIHVGTRLVNGRAIIGKDCVMHINTAIVAGGTNSGAPRLGNNIIMGIGSTLCGNIDVGDNIAVGGHAFVNKSFPDGNLTIAGIPAQKISDKSRNDWNRSNEKEVGEKYD